MCFFRIFFASSNLWCFTLFDGENYIPPYFVYMPDCVLRSSSSISVPWDLHLNLSSKMIKRNLEREEGCVGSVQKILSIFEWIFEYIYIYCICISILWIYMQTHIYIYIYIYTCVYIYGSVYMYIWCLYVSVYIYISTYIQCVLELNWINLIWFRALSEKFLEFTVFGLA